MVTASVWGTPGQSHTRRNWPCHSSSRGRSWLMKQRIPPCSTRANSLSCTTITRISRRRTRMGFRDGGAQRLLVAGPRELAKGSAAAANPTHPGSLDVQTLQPFAPQFSSDASVPSSHTQGAVPEERVAPIHANVPPAAVLGTTGVDDAQENERFRVNRLVTRTTRAARTAGDFRT
jgi:hypothetical protein